MFTKLTDDLLDLVATELGDSELYASEDGREGSSSACCCLCSCCCGGGSGY